MNNIHQIQDVDFGVLMDALYELFQERGDSVTPKHPAQRMEQKLHPHVHYIYATNLYTLLGFVTKNGMQHDDRKSRYNVFNSELLSEKRTQFCKTNVGSKH